MRKLTGARRNIIEEQLSQRRAAIAERIRVCKAPSRVEIGMPTFGWAEAHPLSASVLSAIWADAIYGMRE